MVLSWRGVEADFSRGRICRSRRSSPARVGTRMCVSLFHLTFSNGHSNLVHTNPYDRGANIEQCWGGKCIAEERPSGWWQKIDHRMGVGEKGNAKVGRYGWSGDGATRRRVLVIGKETRNAEHKSDEKKTYGIPFGYAAYRLLFWDMSPEILKSASRVVNPTLRVPGSRDLSRGSSLVFNNIEAPASTGT